jgi:asparagine synthase (glutamine-hydrolysing)
MEMPQWYDEPFGDYSAVPTYLVSRLAASQVKVVLAGDGGDELFGGYRRYEIARKLRFFSRLLPAWGERLAPYIPSRKARRLLRLLGKSEPTFQSHLFSQEQDAFSWEEVEGLGFCGGEEVRWLFEGDYLPESSFLAQAAWEFLYYLPEDLLMKVDRASMRHSLEVRVPLLDRDLVELAWRLPAEYKYPGRGAVPQYKPILRAILRKFLPERLVERPKLGFALPLRVWMREGPLREWMRAMTEVQLLESRWGIPRRKVEALWRRYDRGEEEVGTRLWLLAQLGAFELESRGERVGEAQGLYSRQA